MSSQPEVKPVTPAVPASATKEPTVVAAPAPATPIVEPGKQV